MPNYQNGKIYTIRCWTDENLIYVGSTTQTLAQRLTQHKTQSYNRLSKLYEIVNKDWENWYIELYEEYPCDKKQLLDKKEGEVIRLIGTLNKNIAGRTRKEYEKDNQEQIKASSKEYYEEHKEENKDIKKEYDTIYREKNKQKKAKNDKEYQEKNIDKIKEYQKEYRLKNKEKTKEYNKIYHSNIKSCLIIKDE